MSILRSEGGEVPKDAEVLSYSEALTYQWNQIYEWKPKKETWAFRDGVNIIGTCAGITGLYINTYYRRRLRLTKYGLLTSYVSLGLTPVFLSLIIHKQAISRRILFEKSCPMCLEFRASLLQSVAAIFYPIVLGTSCNFLMAILYATCRVPHINEKRKLFNFWLQTSKPLVRPLSILFIAQCVVTSYITRKEIECLQIMRERLLKVQEQFEEDQQKKSFV